MGGILTELLPGIGAFLDGCVASHMTAHFKSVDAGLQQLHRPLTLFV